MLSNLKNNYFYSLGLLLTFSVISALNKDIFNNISLIYIQIILLILIIIQSKILITKIVSTYFLIIYILPFFVWEYFDSIKTSIQVYPLDSVLFFILMFFLIEFIMHKYQYFNTFSQSIKYSFRNDRLIILYSLNVLILIFAILLILPDIIGEYYPDIFKYTLYAKVTELPFIGQILKKCIFLSFINLTIIIYYRNKLNLIFFLLIYFLFLILALLKTSRSEVILINIPIFLYLIKKRYYFTFPLIFLIPYFTYYLVKIRYFFDDYGINISNMKKLAYQMIFESKIDFYNLTYIKSITKASYSSFYERISFTYEYLTIYFYNFKSADNKYLFNLDAILPRLFFKNKTVRPYEPNETLLLNLRNIEDTKTTVSLGPITESLYILHINYLIVPIILGLLFFILNFILKFNKIFCFSFSIYLGYVFAKSAETYTFISIDIIFFIIIIYIYKYFIFKKKNESLIN